MKVETKLSNEQIMSTTEKSIDMRITQKNVPMMFKLIVERLYRNKLGSMIREVTSNCYDSHIEAGVDTPVIVKLSKEAESGHYLSFIDNGVGMSPERVEEIYCSLGESTKNDTNDEIGGFGIGGKTPLAYTKSFFIITRYDGIKYTYAVRMGEQVPVVEEFAREATDEHNGTEVKVKIPENEIHSVHNEIKKQLYYFENIVFEGFGDAVSNDYKIYKGKNFVYRGEDYNRRMHVCLGKVAYPIDYSALELDEYDYSIPVAIKLEIGEVKVIPSREDLEYDAETKKVIIKKLDEVKQELRELLIKQYGEITTLKEYYNVTNRFGILNLTEDCAIDVGSVVEKNDLNYTNFRYNDFKIPNQNRMLELFYNVKRYGKPVAKRSWNEKFEVFNGKWGSLEEISNVFHVKDNEEFERKVMKQSYLNTTKGRFFLFTPKEMNDITTESWLKAVGAIKEKVTDNWDDDVTYENVLPKSKAMPLLKKLRKEFLKMVEEITENYNSFEVPEDYVEAKKNSNKLSQDILKVGIPVKGADTYGRGRRVTIEELKKFNGRIYYGFRDDEYRLNSAHRLASQLSDNVQNVKDRYYEFPEKGMIFIQISKGNEKYMKMLGKNVLHVKYFYQTFVVRRKDYIVENKLKTMIDQKYNYEVHDVFKQDGFEFIDAEIAENVKTIKDSLHEDYGKRINGSLDETKFEMLTGVDVSKLTIDDYKHKDILDKLIGITKRSEKYLKYFELPYRLREDNVTEELKTLLELAINK